MNIPHIKMIVIAVVASVLLCLATLSFAATESLTTERFKSFLRSPPIISNLVYVVEQHDSPDPTTGVLVKRRETSYHIKMQNNAFLMRVFPNSSVNQNDTNKATKSVGKYERLYWDLADRGGHFDLNYWEEDGNKKNEPFAQYRMYRGFASEVLSLGIGQVDLSTLVWNENKFTVAGYPFDNVTKVDFTGEIKQTQEGISLNVDRILPDKRTLRTVVHYEYGEPLSLPFMPRRIIAADLAPNGTTVRRRIYVIQEMMVVSAPLPKVAFLPSTNMYSGSKATTTYYTNAGRYFQLGGALKHVRSLSEAPQNVTKARRSTYFKYIYPLCLFGFALLIWAIYRNNKQTKVNEHERK